MTLDWSRIRSWETFQDLVNALIAFEDPAARPYNRPGKDGGQDARSSDGTVVYQAKFHAAANNSTVISDATKELASIGKHRTAGSPTAARWEGVTAWVMATNAAGSPALDQQWASEIKPLFTAIGLDATLWTTAQLGPLLTKHPAVKQQYFDNGTRIVVTLPEHEAALQRRAPSLFVPWGAGAFRSRADDVERVVAFAGGPKSFLLVHGAGGVGKSRFAIEAARVALAQGAIEQVLVAQNESMTTTANWFDGIVAERSTLLILDEPSEPSLVRRLLDEVSSGRAKSWKVLVCGRSMDDALIARLSTPTDAVADPLRLAPLDKAAARAVSEELIRASLPADTTVDLPRAAEIVATFCGGFPVWIDAAVGLIAKEQGLGDVVRAQDMARLWRRYVHDALGGAPDDNARAVLRWLSLVQPIARPLLYSIVSNHGELAEEKAEPALDALVAAGLVRQYGREKRMVSVVPDVFRDLTLRDWLGRGQGQVGASAEGKKVVRTIVDALRMSAMPEHTVEATALRALGRIELFADLPGLVQSAIDAIAEDVRKASTAADLRAVAQMSFTLAPYQPAAFAKLSALMRAHQVADSPESGLFRDRIITHAIVLREIAWPLFVAGGNTRDEETFAAVADELRHIYEATAGEKARARNDGKAPADLWGRLLAETHSDAAFRVVGREVQAAMSRLEKGTAERLGDDSLIGLALSRRRSRFESDGKSATIGWVIINPGSSADKLRLEIRERLWKLASTSEAEAIRARVLRLLEKAHHEARGEVEGPRLPEVKDDLVRVLGLLQRSPAPSPVEAQLLRQIWDWDLKYEREAHQDIKAAAAECEDAYRRLPLAAEVQHLFGEWYGENVEKAHDDAAARLSTMTVGEIADWFEQMAATLAIRPRDERHRLGSIGYRLGKLATEAARTYALTQVCVAPENSTQFFAANRVIAGLRDAARAEGEQALRALHDDVIATTAAATEARLGVVVRQFHGALHRTLNAADFALLEADLPLFQDDPVALAQILAWLYPVDPQRVERLVDGVLTATHGPATGRVVSAFMEELHLALRQTALTGGQSAWLASLLVHVDDIDDDLGTGASFHFGELVKGRPLTWAQFSDLLDRRLTRDEKNAVPRRFPLEQVAPAPTGGDETVREAALEKLLAALDAHPNAYFDLPEMIVKLDAMTGALASVLERRVQAMTSPSFDELAQVATFGGLMFVERPDMDGPTLGNGPADDRWRRIALAVCGVCGHLSERDRNGLYYKLTSQGSRAYWGGETHDAAVRLAMARSAASSESNPTLMPLWQWRIAYLEGALTRAREHDEEREE